MMDAQWRHEVETLKKERDDARREAEDLRRQLVEAQAREVQARELLLKLYNTPSMQLLENGHAWIREAVATKPNTDALRVFGLKCIKTYVDYDYGDGASEVVRAVDAVLAGGSR